jgi:hypothetical protein
MRLCEVVVKGPYFLGEEFSPVTCPAARAIRIGQNENLIHTYVDGIRLTSLGQFIGQCEHYLVEVRVEGAVTSTVDALVIRVLLRCLIELRVCPEQAESLCFPGLMPQKVNERDQPYPCPMARRDDGLDICFGRSVGVDNLRVADVRIPVVEFHDQHIDAFFGKGFTNEADGEWDFVRLRRREIEAANGH